MKNNWKTRVYIIIAIMASCYLSFGFPVGMSSQLNLLIVSSTMFILVLYTYDTNRMATQTIESALRPVILRQGKILDWRVKSITDIQNDNNFTLEFVNYKNISKDIRGHIIIDQKKYKLHFGNKITEDVVTNDGDDIGKKIILLERWGWLPVGGVLKSSYEVDKFEITTKDNEIYLEYQDIESNKYFTRENKDFSQTSEKI